MEKSKFSQDASCKPLKIENALGSDLCSAEYLTTALANPPLENL
jgi:hypothetical protein